MKLKNTTYTLDEIAEAMERAGHTSDEIMGLLQGVVNVHGENNSLGLEF